VLNILLLAGKRLDLPGWSIATQLCSATIPLVLYAQCSYRGQLGKEALPIEYRLNIEGNRVSYIDLT
jgi:hypothetical protein